MKIISLHKTAFSLANEQSKSQGKKGGVRLLLSRLGSVILALIFLFIILSYGIYLKKTDYTVYIKEALLKVAKLDFAFVGNYASGHFTNPQEIKIDIKFQHLQRLEYLREKSLQKKYILESYKEESFPAELTYKGKSYPVKIAMTGKVATGHLLNPAKWSFQVKVKGDETINGMKRFGLLIPESRGFLTDWIALKLLKNRGLIQLRSDFFDVSINGKKRGLFYLEERFDKHLVENNRLREGIIFKIEEDLHPYKESKLLLNSDTRPQLLLVKQMWQDVMAGNLAPEKFFDLKKMAKLFVIIDLMNEKHPLVRENLRFYFNPVTGLAEPIAREFKNLDNSSPPPLALFLEEPKGESRHLRLTRDKVNRLIYDNIDFKRYYLQEAEIVCQEQFLRDFFAENKAQLDLLLEQVHRTWPFYDLPSSKLYQYQNYMRSVLFPTSDQLIASFVQQKKDQLSIHLQNQQFLPLEVSHLSWRDSVVFYPSQPILLDSKAKNLDDQEGYYSFQIPAELQAKNNFRSNLKVHYHLLGLEEKTKSVVVGTGAGIAWQEAAPSSNGKGNQPLGFMDEVGDKWIIPAGKWVISQDLSIPKGKNLHITPGTEIDLINQARIISYAPIFSIGKEETPIIIKSSDATGKGLVVLHSDRRSLFSHTYFQHGSDQERAGYISNSFLTFYDSPVTILACRFSDAQVNGDFVQIIRSDFSIDKTEFANLQASAIRCTDCKGEIINSRFEKITGSGVRIKGARSAVKLRQINMNQIDGEAISVAENGQLEAQWTVIRKAKVGILSKDRSIAQLSDITLQDTKNGLVLLQQSPQFGPAKITAMRTSIKQSQHPFLIEEGSILVLDNKNLPPNRKNVQELIYTATSGSLSYQ